MASVMDSVLQVHTLTQPWVPGTAQKRHQGYWRNRKRACLASTRYWDRNPGTPRMVQHYLLRYGVVGNISACHADARGSIPRFGVFIFFRVLLAQIFFFFTKVVCRIQLGRHTVIPR